MSLFNLKYVLLLTFYMNYKNVITPYMIVETGARFYSNYVEGSIILRSDIPDSMVPGFRELNFKVMDLPLSGMEFTVGKTVFPLGTGIPYSIINFLSKPDWKYPGIFDKKNPWILQLSYFYGNTSFSMGSSLPYLYPYGVLSTTLLGFDIEAILMKDTLWRSGISLRKDFYLLGAWMELNYYEEDMEYLTGIDFAIKGVYFNIEVLNGYVEGEKDLYLIPSIKWNFLENFLFEFISILSIQRHEITEIQFSYRRAKLISGIHKDNNYFISLGYEY